MEKGSTQERSLEFILSTLEVSKEDIGCILSQLDSQEYDLDDYHYMARTLSKKSENNAKKIVIKNYFALIMKGVGSENKLNDHFQEYMDKKKMWTLLEKIFGAICTKLPDASVNGQTYLFVCSPNQKCPKVTYTDSLIFFSPNERKIPGSKIL